MPELLWVVKTASSKSLSHSEAQERLQVFSQAQRTSRRKRYLYKPEYGKDTRLRRRNACLLHPKDAQIARALDAFQDWTLAERRGNAFFQEIAVHKILGLHANMAFWKEQLPYIVQQDRGCRHLVVAIGATFELLFRPNFKQLNLFALEQCNKAIDYLLLRQDTEDAPLVLASCVLVCAYNLLRGDLAAADRSIQCGHRLANGTSSAEAQPPRKIIQTLLNNHGYAKLWAPDVGFLFDKTMAGEGVLELVQTPTIAPFLAVEQVMAVFKTLVIEYTAKCMRNLSLGAHIDPASFFAAEVRRCFSDTFSEWDQFYRLLSSGDNEDQMLQLEQLKIGILSAYVLFMGKVLASDERHVDKVTSSYQELLGLGERVVAARHSGKKVIYMGRIVNSALYASALICREPQIRRDLIHLLKSQLIYPEDGLVNHIRGRAAECVAAIEEYVEPGEEPVLSCTNIPLDRRVLICDLHCDETRILSVFYIMATDLDRMHVRKADFPLGYDTDAFSVDLINTKLQEQMTGTKMYMKADCYEAPDGCLRRMVYHGQPVPVRFSTV